MVKVSIVVPARNEETEIRSLLESFKKQTFKDFEVIVVDGNSSDKTREIAKKLGARVIPESGKYRSPANARNLGVKAARGEIVGIMDADTFVNREFLKSIVEEFNRGGKRVFGVNCSIQIVKDTFWSRVRAAFIAASEAPRTPFPLFIRREYRKAIGEWDASVGFAEDRLYVEKINTFLAKRKELKTSFARNAVLYLHVTRSLDELFNQQCWYGRTIRFYLAKTRNPREKFTIIRAGYPLMLLALVFPDPGFLVSLPWLALTAYHVVKALAKGQVFGLFIPVLDFCMGLGFAVGLVESVYRKERGRD